MISRRASCDMAVYADAGGRSYYWGHYHVEEARAEGDFRGRIKDYADRYGCHISEKIGVELYKYYSTQRPVDIGTFPKSVNNPPVGFTNYDERRLVEDSSFRAWGELLYLDPLMERDISDYELRPAPDNPDWVKPSIAAQLAESADKAAKEKAAGLRRRRKQTRSGDNFGPCWPEVTML